MYQRPVLGLTEAQVALDAMLKEAAKTPGRPVAIAIVDSAGELICYSRMDGTGNVPRKIAMRKAYTSGRSGADSRAFAEQLERNNLSAGDIDPKFVGAPGGICLINNGVVLGGIGVSGRLADDDEHIARVGVASFGF